MAHRNPRNFHIPAPRASRDSSRYYGIELDRTLLASAPPNLFRTGAQRLFVSGHRVQGSPLPPTAQVMDSYLVFLCLRRRYPNRDRRALMHLALDPQRAVMQLHDMLDDRQPEPRAAKLARARAIDA